MTMLCTLIRGQLSYTFFSWGHMSSYVNCLGGGGGGRYPHMPFFIGGHMSGGGNVLHSSDAYLFSPQ